MIARTEINPALVRRLLAAQLPDLAGLPIRQTDAGIDNAMFRLGDKLAAHPPAPDEALLDRARSLSAWDGRAIPATKIRG